MEYLLRFLIGGIVVSLFAVLGDMFKPKSFAGLFAAAPSVALATLGLTIAKHGGAYAAVEGHAMLAGAVALFACSQFTAWTLMRYRWHSLLTSFVGILVWFAVAFGLWAIWLRQGAA